MAYNVSHEVLLFAGVVALAMCIFFDIGMAYKRGARWLPVYAVVIYALCLQLVGYLDVQNVSIGSRDKDQQLELLISKQLSIDSSRLVLFVFVGYLVPNLATGSDVWTNIAALFTSLSTHIAIELSVALRSRVSEKAKVVKGQSGIWVIVSGFVMLESFLSFLFLICWAIGRGRFIRDNLSSRIPLALESPEINNEIISCQSEMLKSWIVARVCQPEYVLNRSFFSLLLLSLVTFNVEFIGVKLIFLRSQLQKPFPLFTIQMIFSVLGWFVVSLRCLFLFESNGAFNTIGDVNSATRYIPTIIVLAWKVRSLLLGKGKNYFHSFRRSAERLLISKPISSLMSYLFLIFMLLVTLFMLALPVALYMLLVALLVAFLVAFFMLLLVSLPLWFGIFVVLDIMTAVLSSSESPEDEDFRRCKEALKRVCMPNENEKRLWVENKSSFDHIKQCIERAHGRGNNCEKLKNVTVSRLRDTPPSEDVQEVLEPLESVRMYFPLLKDSFRRITAFYLLRMVYLIDDFISEDQHSPRELIKDVDAAFKEAKELMDFLDCPDTVGISLDVLSISNLEAFNLKGASVSAFEYVRNNFRESSTLVTAVDKLYNEADNKLQSCKLLGAIDSLAIDTDWSKAAEPYVMYKVCNFIRGRLETDSVEQLLYCLINMVADLIAMCVRDSPRILVERSRKWAAEFREDKICAAIELAGFACGVIDGVNAAPPSYP